MNFTIGLVSPYEKLTNKAIKISHEKKIPLTARTAVMEQAILNAKEMEANGIDVIIVRDINLREQINIPVVPIAINSTDILRAIVKARKISNKIILANFRNRYKDISLLEEAIKCSIKQFIFYNEKEARTKIKRMVGKIDVLIGGGLTTSIASEYGIKSILIESGEETIQYALKVACNIAETMWHEQQKFEEMSTIINHSIEGIIAIDRNKNITIFNPEAEKLFNVSFNEIIGKRNDYILKVTGLSKVIKTKEPIEKIVKINGKDFIVYTVPIIVSRQISGGVSTLQNVTQVQEKEHNIRVNLNAKGLTAKSHFEDIIGISRAIKDTIFEAKKFAKSEFTILITGESGTGKELFAQSIHNYSNRQKGPFVAINCAAIPFNLLEAELFGYEEGSFTGAKKGGKAGLFELAHNGTIFLDEIGELALELQARLLRVIQEKEVIRVGGNKIIPIDVRIIAATNVQLLDKVFLHGSFREDLYYRLSVLNLNIPPLRKRINDIPLIAAHILKKYNVKNQDINIIILALNTFNNYEWRGNVRELENILAKLTVLLKNNEITYNSVINELRKTFSHYYQDKISPTKPINSSDNYNLKEINIETEKDLLYQLIKQADMSRDQIAERLGISRTTLWRKLKKYNLI